LQISVVLAHGAAVVRSYPQLAMLHLEL